MREVLKKSGGKLGMTEIQELYYLERCIKESMRLYPPVPTIFRYIAEDLQLSKISNSDLLQVRKLMCLGRNAPVHVKQILKNSNQSFIADFFY